MTTPLPGDFELTHISGSVGIGIRIGQFLNGDGFKDFEHARLYLGDGKCIEAEPGGARVADVRLYDSVSHRWSTGIIQLTDAERAKIVAAGYSYVGVPYSFADYFALAADRLHIPAPHLDTYVKSTGHMICSQLVARCYFDAGHPLFAGWTGDVTPGDLTNLLDRLSK
jgi:uncharacterized protein YycO